LPHQFLGERPVVVVAPVSFLVFLSTFNPQHIHRKIHLSQSSNLTLHDNPLLNCLWNTLGTWVIVWSMHGLSCTHILPAILELSNHLCHQSTKHNTTNLLQSCCAVMCNLQTAMCATLHFWVSEGTKGMWQNL